MIVSVKKPGADCHYGLAYKFNSPWQGENWFRIGNKLISGKPMLSDAHQRVFAVLKAVPCGAVVSYGQVAELAGLGKGARLVGQILCALPKDTEIPWHRVVNVHGVVSLQGDARTNQINLLESEGICVQNNRVDIQKYRWTP